MRFRYWIMRHDESARRPVDVAHTNEAEKAHRACDLLNELATHGERFEVADFGP